MKNIINTFQPISLKEMKSVALLKRIDTKFIFHKKDLIPVLEEIKNDYKVLEIKKNRVMTYQTLYFDTETKKFYHDHHNGKTIREKVRIRKYVESNRCFLEVKQKDVKGKMNKSRIAIPYFETDLPGTAADFIKQTTFQDYDLIPTVGNKFNRVTLVNNTDKERVTIDVNLIVKKNESEKCFENLVIIEAKQERFIRNSPIVKTLKTYRIHPFRISKYCIGMISLCSDLKYNEFKIKLLKISKIGA